MRNMDVQSCLIQESTAQSTEEFRRSMLVCLMCSLIFFTCIIYLFFNFLKVCDIPATAAAAPYNETIRSQVQRQYLNIRTKQGLVTQAQK